MIPRVLPERCHVVLPGLPAGQNVAVAVLGESGVRLTTIDLGDWVTAQRTVRALNQTRGVDSDAERRMLAGCMLGWSGVQAWGLNETEAGDRVLH